MAETIKLQIVETKEKEVDLKDLEKHIGFSFRDWRTENMYGFATFTVKTPYGNANFDYTVWKSKRDGSPRLSVKHTNIGYTAAVNVRNGYTNAQEGAVDSALLSAFNAVLEHNRDRIMKAEDKRTPEQKAKAAQRSKERKVEKSASETAESQEDILSQTV